MLGGLFLGDEEQVFGYGAVLLLFGRIHGGPLFKMHVCVQYRYLAKPRFRRVHTLRSRPVGGALTMLILCVRVRA